MNIMDISKGQNVLDIFRALRVGYITSIIHVFWKKIENDKTTKKLCLVYLK